MIHLMLHDFVSTNRDELLSRTRAKVSSRPWPSASAHELENGIPLFLTQLSETLRLESGRAPFPDGSIGSTAARHGAELLAEGYTISQVVHDYGDVCQAITELAVEKEAGIRPEEFHTLNRCLDTAIAEAVTEYARLQREATSHQEVERFGRLAHELRNLLQTAFLSFDVLKKGRVGIAGSTGAVLGRSLVGLGNLVDTALSEVRLAAGKPRHDRVSLPVLLDEIAVAARLHAEYRGIQLTVETADPALGIEVDKHLLASALMNLLQNAFKYTREHGRVVLRTQRQNGRVPIEVEDECGGLLNGEGDGSRPFGKGAGPIGPVSGSACRTPARPSRPSAASSARKTCPARAASSPSTSPPSLSAERVGFARGARPHAGTRSCCSSPGTAATRAGAGAGAAPSRHGE